MNETVETDKATGMAFLFGVLAVIGAGVMLFGGSQLLMAWGFAAAMLAGTLAVVAVQLYND